VVTGYSDLLPFVIGIVLLFIGVGTLLFVPGYCYYSFPAVELITVVAYHYSVAGPVTFTLSVCCLGWVTPDYIFVGDDTVLVVALTLLPFTHYRCGYDPEHYVVTIVFGGVHC
jgi:hypothetical protein